MSEEADKQEGKQPATQAAPPEQAPDQLSKLMAGGAKAAPNLEQKAFAAAEAAIAESQRALDEARERLRQQSPPGAGASTLSTKKRRGRELALRILLGVNLAAMVTVALLPTPKTGEPAQPAHESATPHTEAPAHDPVVGMPRLDDPVLKAFAAADRRDYRGAIALLEQHLADTPRLDAAKKANVLLALEHYATQLGDIPAAQDYQRRMEALRNSHSLPEDLIQMALEAERNGDVESMRKTYARLLLQQRQIPSSLYRHVAEAYLKLGDSYRQEAEKAEEVARTEELRELRARLREQAAADTGGTGK